MGQGHAGGKTPPPSLRLGCGFCPLLFGHIGVRSGLRKLRPHLLIIYRLRAPNALPGHRVVSSLPFIDHRYLVFVFLDCRPHYMF